MGRNAMHTTADIVTVFARQGIALSTIARAMAIPVERVDGMCRRAHENDELQMIPPMKPDDTRHALLSEVTNLRAQLDDAQAQIRSMNERRETSSDVYTYVGGLTRKEAEIVAAIVRYGRATKASLYHSLYGGTDAEEQREPKIIDVYVCKIRKKLRPLGVAIGTQWGVGYTMEPDDIARLNELAGLSNLPVVESPPTAPVHAEAYP